MKRPTRAARLLALLLQLPALLWSLTTGAQTPTTVAGSIPGQFKVTESGAASYRIPIQVPPGVAGMEPKLAMVYNSQAGNGLLGVGWSLEGLSAITRCPRTLASDGVRGSVNFDLNDRYCLDGQRLILVSGVEGTAGAEYRTERESYSKIVAYGSAGNGPAYWVVKTKAGLTMEYGNTDDSRALNQLGTTARVWSLSKMSDVKGNTLMMNYFKSSDSSVQVPMSISYAGNASAGIPNNLSITFEYDTARPDKSQGYMAGSLIQTDRRILAINAHVDATLVQTYRLLYQDGALIGSSTLKSVQLCTLLDTCFPAIAFQWQGEGNIGWTAADAGMSVAWNPQYVWMADYNGDGKTDVLSLQDSDASFGAKRYVMFLSNGSGGFTAADAGMPVAWNPQYVWMGDCNGDGKTDVLSMQESVSGFANKRYVLFSSLTSSPGFLVGIADEHAPIKIAIGHIPLTDSTAYTKDAGSNAAVYPKLDLQYPLYVVSQVEQSNGVGGVITTQYKYGGLKAEQGTGRGLLGFRWMSAKNLATGVETYTEYRQDWPYTGTPLKNETRLAGAGAGGVLKRSTNSVACQTPQTGAACTTAAGNRYFAYVAQSVEESWDLGGAPYPSIITSYVYGQSPQWGDPTQITVSTSDGASKTTVNEYWPADTSNWILGRLKKATVTSSKP